ncbi:N-acetyltransferase 9 [Stylosanthes scabra]|uniref:N-acetyltransferase 9 n=1 Tax=Stylosanthes scabra TaxID=79078 RepID=A0ABU6YRK4_9FABA|nr:N-acetyltransferase 9 [Stylosanthes scabra]
MQRSILIPNLLLFDPEIKRTLRRARQVRRQLEFESNLHSQTQNLASANNSGYSSDPDFDRELSTSSSDSGTWTTGDIPRLTLKQLGGASITMENQPARYPKLNDNFELKSSLINLLPRFHGFPREVSIKHLKDFEVICGTTRRIGGDEDARWSPYEQDGGRSVGIETMADANQHFKTRATNKGVHEVAPSESTILAKSLVDIASMLKEIKEGQQPTPTILKRQPEAFQQIPVKHCGICACNSHQTDECPQLQEDNTMA